MLQFKGTNKRRHLLILTGDGPWKQSIENLIISGIGSFYPRQCQKHSGFTEPKFTSQRGLALCSVLLRCLSGWFKSCVIIHTLAWLSRKLVFFNFTAWSCGVFHSAHRDDAKSLNQSEYLVKNNNFTVTIQKWAILSHYIHAHLLFSERVKSCKSAFGLWGRSRQPRQNPPIVSPGGILLSSNQWPAVRVTVGEAMTSSVRFRNICPEKVFESDLSSALISKHRLGSPVQEALCPSQQESDAVEPARGLCSSYSSQYFLSSWAFYFCGK